MSDLDRAIEVLSALWDFNSADRARTELEALHAENATFKENNSFLLIENASLHKSIDNYMNGSAVSDLRAENASLRALLKESEWLPIPQDWGFNKRCPICGNLEVGGHAPDCRLAKALPKETQ